MGNRDITYTLRLDDQLSGPIAKVLGDISGRLRNLDAQFKSMGSGTAAASLGSSTVRTAAASPATASGPASSRMVDQYLRDLNRWAGVHDRKFDRMISILERIANAPGRPAGATAHTSSQSGPSGTAQGQNHPWMSLSNKRIGAAAAGGFATHIGGQIGQSEGNELTGAAIAGVGMFATGAAVGGPLGGLLGGVSGVLNYFSVADDLEDKKFRVANLKSREDARTKKFQDQGNAQHKYDLGLEADLASARARGVDDLSDYARGNTQKSNDRRLSVLGKNIDQYNADLTTHENNTSKDLSAEQRQRYKDEEARAAERLNGFLQEERQLRVENLKLAADEATAAKGLADASRGNFNNLNRQKSGLYGDLESARDRMRGNAGEFGELSASRQRRTARIAGKIDAGQSLTRSELRFASSNPLLQEDATKLNAQRAEESGNFTEGLKRRAGQLHVDQIQGQIARVQEQLGQNAELEIDIKIDEAKAIEKVEKLKAALEESGVLRFYVEPEINPKDFVSSVTKKNAAGP